MKAAPLAGLLTERSPLSLGLALGILLPSLKATMSTLSSGGGGDLFFDLALLGFAVGLIFRFRAGGRRPQLVAVAAPVTVWLAGVVLMSGVGLSPALRTILGNASSAAAFLLMFVMAREGLSLDRIVPGASLPGLPVFLLAIAFGLVLGGSLLPLVGPSLTFIIVLVLVAWPRRRAARRMRPALVLSFIVLALLALADVLPVRTYLPEADSGGGQVVRHAWYVDGPAQTVNAGRRLLRTTLAGGSWGWQSVRSVASGREARRSIALSTMMARELAPGGELLLIGPAAGAAWQDVPPRRGNGVIVLDERRTAWWFRRSLPAGTQPWFRMVPWYGRDPLLAQKGSFDLVHYIDPFDAEALSGGAPGRQPAYQLTVESVKRYLEALNEDGILVFEVPYSLRMVAILREIGSRENFPVDSNLLVYHEPGSGRDVIVFRKTPLERDQVKRMNRMATRRRAVIYYQPAERLMVNPIVRLIWARHPRGYYAAGKEEITPPTDDRPFFYQIQKFVPRTRQDERIGLTPLQNRRILGVIPPGELPWLTLAAAGLLGSAVLLFRRLSRRKRQPDAEVDWRYRFLAFFSLNGVALGLFVRGGIMILGRDLLPSHMALGWAGSIVLTGLAAGLLLDGWPANRVHSLPLWRMWLMLPAMMLPVVSGLALRAPVMFPLGTLVWIGSLAPALLFGGAVIGDGLTASRWYGSLPLAQAMGLLLLGGLAGGEMAIPVSQTFGFTFSLVSAWLIFFISLRIFRRIPAGRIPESGNVAARGRV